MIAAAVGIPGERNCNGVINRRMIFWRNCDLVTAYRKHRRPHCPANRSRREAKEKRRTVRKKTMMKPTGRKRWRDGSIDKPIQLGISDVWLKFEKSSEEDRITYTNILWTNTSILVYNVILRRIGCRTISETYAFCKAVLAIERRRENRMNCTKVMEIFKKPSTIIHS